MIKLVLVMFSLLSISSVTLADQVCIDVPAGVSYASIITNFDGSITVTVPRVTVQGRPLRIAYTQEQGGAQGLCHLLGKPSLIDVSYRTDWDNSKDPVVFLDSGGALLGLPDGHWTDSISRVMCR